MSKVYLMSSGPLVRTWLICLILMASYSKLSSQIFSEPNPNFSIDIDQGCSPYKITLTDLVTDQNDSIFYYFRNTLDPRICSRDYQNDFGPCINGEPLGVLNRKFLEFSYLNDSTRPEEFIIIQSKS